MKITLEKSDLVAIVAKHLGLDASVTEITVKADPFEVEISGIPLPMEEVKKAGVSEKSQVSSIHRAYTKEPGWEYEPAPRTTITGKPIPEDEDLRRI